MATHIQRLRGTTAQTALYTGLPAELTVDTDKHTVVVHDGVTPGGFPLALEGSTSQELYFNVKDETFAGGAKGDGVTDDGAAIQACIDYARTVGGTVFFPPGQYLTTTQLVLDYTINNWGEMDNRRVNILGSGQGNTHVIWGGSDTGALWRIKGPDERNDRIHSYTSFSHMLLRSQNVLKGNAFYVTDTAFWHIHDVVIRQFDYAFVCVDFLSSMFTNVLTIGCRYGFYANRQNFTVTDADYESGPNNLTFVGCSFSACVQYAMWIIGGGCITYLGGSIENNGTDALSVDPRWGVKMDYMGVEAAVGCNFVGTYFEGNHGTADVWIDQALGSSNPVGTGVSYTFTGVQFQRVSPVDYTINNIKFATAWPSGLSITGCGFRAANGYVASSDRPCIQLPDVGRGWFANQTGNYFSDEVDRPMWVKTPQFIAALETNQVIPNVTPTKVNFIALENYGGCFDSAANSFTAPYNLRMRFNVQVSFTGAPVDGPYLNLELRVNGFVTAAYAMSTQGMLVLPINCNIPLAKGDVVTIHVGINTSGASRTAYASLATTYWTGEAM